MVTVDKNIGRITQIIGSTFDAEFAEEDVYELTPEEREDIEEGIRQSKAGLGIPHETVMAEMREWLRTRK